MIRELFKYHTTKSSRIAKEFGHLYESIAIIEREKRCQNFWKPHRDNCKNFILNNLEILNQKNVLLILGAGPLHEIPIDELSKNFKTIYLVDIVHLNETKHKYSYLKNLNFIEHDITEIEEDILNKKILINKIPNRFQQEKIDLVISSNLLSQISVHLKNYVTKNLKNKFTDDEINLFGQNIIQNHLTYLSNFACPVFLITDIEGHYFDSSHNILEKEINYKNLELPLHSKEWMWNLAPIPEISKEISLQLKVRAFILNK